MSTILKIGTNAIAGLTSIGGLELSADTIETTTLGTSGWRTFMQGLKDGGEVSLSGYFDTSDTGQNAIYNAFTAGTAQTFAIIFPSTLGAEWDFTGIVTGITTGAELEDLVSFEATVKVSGAPSLGLTASAGLSALSLAGAGGTLSPAFANGTYYYSFAGVTATSITVTATAVNHNLALYVDGVFSQILVSGAASNSIPVAAGSKKLTILANESGKTQKIYEIVVIK
jgi:hypothetical protein